MFQDALFTYTFQNISGSTPGLPANMMQGINVGTPKLEIEWENNQWHSKKLEEDGLLKKLEIKEDGHTKY